MYVMETGSLKKNDEVNSSFVTTILLIIIPRYFQILEEVLLRGPDVLTELEHSHMTVQSLSRVLRHRDSEHWSKQDEEEALSQGRNEALGYMLEKLRERRHLWIAFLESLRIMNYAFQGIRSSLPLKRCILWFVSSPWMVAKIVDCVSRSKAFHNCVSDSEEFHHTPFFWPTELSAVSQSSDLEFLYRYCALFSDIETELILVYPQESNEESFRAAVSGASSKWKPSLVVYSTLGRGQHLGHPVLCTATTSADQFHTLLDDMEEKSWLNLPFHNYEEEYILFHQMIWLAQLVCADQAARNKSDMPSSLLGELQWHVSPKPGELTPNNEAILLRHLKNWEGEDKKLLDYIKKTRLWRNDSTSFCHLSPCDTLRKMLLQTPTHSSPPPMQFPQLKLHSLSTNEMNWPDLNWFVQAQADSSLCGAPTVVCGGISQTSQGITSPGFTEIAAENCCNLTIDCIMNAFRIYHN